MWSTLEEIAAGDTVIIWFTRDELQPLVVTPGKELNGKFGTYRHSDLIGVPYGSKVGSRNGRGFIHVLRPTPELWTLALPHRTQILYLADISFVVSHLNIRPGSRVVEAGTGSGSFSHAVARTLGSTGRLYTYEFHELRAEKAREEFQAHGLADIIIIQHRNVCKDGFSVNDEVDAVFLDLPAPWEAIPYAKQALRKDKPARICCFSPCMEQVLRTVMTLNETGFTDITMYETLLRPHEVHTTPTLRSVKEVGDKLKQAEARREVKRLKQVAASAALREKKRKRANCNEKPTLNQGEDATQMTLDSPVAQKRSRANGEGSDETLANTQHNNDRMDVETCNLPPPEVRVKNEMENGGEVGFTTDDATMGGTPTEIVMEEPPASPPPRVVSKVMQEVRGHTSYLTFAVLLPTMLPGSNNDLPQVTPTTVVPASNDA